jgi:hypothetical protein
MDNTTKPKRKLKDINFEKEGSHVALVSKQQGGGANKSNYSLILKSSKFSPEFVEKASKIKIELSITDYLTRFFGVYGADAELLARSLGFVTPGMDSAAMEAAEEALEANEPPEYPEWDSKPGDEDYEAYINSTQALSELREDEYLALITDQALVEKAFKQIDKQTAKPVKAKATVAKADTQITNLEVITSEPTKETNMTSELNQAEVAKAADAQTAVVVELQKALDEQKQQLQKALDTIALFEAEKKEQLMKARKAEVISAVKDEQKAEVLFKALKDSADEDFKAVVKALTELTAAVEKSDLFKEIGATSAEAPSNESAVEKLLKAKYKKA